MAQLLNAHPRFVAGGRPSPAADSPPRRNYAAASLLKVDPPSRSEWAALQRKVGGGGRHSCFFSDGRKQDQAKKALESALGGKKTEFEKWNKEIEKRESGGGGGGASGRGGWFGGGGWSSWSNDEHFWGEAKQAGITLGALLSLYLLLTKGSVMFAVVFNSLLFVLRGIRTRAEFVVSRVSGKVSGKATASRSQVATTTQASSAKERIASKWGSG